MQGWRVRKLSATCLGVRACRPTILASTRPLALCGKGKLPVFKWCYPITAIHCQCSTTVDAVRSRDNLNDRTPDRNPFAHSGARPQEP